MWAAGVTLDCMGAQVPVGVQFEAVDLEAIGVTPGKSPVTELVAWCALALGANALEPKSVRLVIAGDFTGSVNARMGSVGPVFDTRRNGGMVGAKNSFQNGCCGSLRQQMRAQARCSRPRCRSAWRS